MAQVTEFCKRLMVSADVSSKALEYHRLSELKCPRGSISSSCMAIVCIELAASQLGDLLDKKQAQRLSGVRPKVYLTSYRAVEKLLDISTNVGIQELAVRFGCLTAIHLAEEILHRYKEQMQGKYSVAQREGLDLEKPLFVAAALYCGCKLLKIRCEKGKFQSVSAGAKTMFQNVLEEMLKCAPENVDEFKKGKKRKLAEEKSLEHTKETEKHSTPIKKVKREPLYSRILSDPTSDVYLEWKEKILRLAETKASPGSDSD